MDLVTEAWRPRGRWAGTRRPGPHQTLASGPMRGRGWAWLLPPRRIHQEREENVVKFPARKISLSCSFIPELEQVSLLSFTSHKHRFVASQNSSMDNLQRQGTRSTTPPARAGHHIIPLRLDLWQCVIQTLVVYEEHKQNNSQLIPGP